MQLPVIKLQFTGYIKRTKEDNSMRVAKAKVHRLKNTQEKKGFALISSQALFGPSEVAARALQREEFIALEALEQVNEL